MKIQVFQQEIEDGIAEVIQANASLAYCTQLWDTKLTQEVVRKTIATEPSVQDQFDLFYLNTILVTTGWNKNSDVFPKSETWKARYTPVDKQFNLEHDHRKIIGHMTSAKAVDESFNEIADDTSIDLLPDKFHILTGAVIYRQLSPDTEIGIEQLIYEIEAGEWYVSMECLFRGFDYAVILPDGSKSFIERNEESSFLTKHLRQYGGTGKYKDYVLGRALKNITFSGKGLVRKPANPESIIFNQAVASFNENYRPLVYIINNDENNNSKHEVETFVMAEQDNAIKDLEKKNSELAKANEELLTQVKTFESSQTKAKIAELENVIVAKDEKIVSLEADLTAKAATIVELEKKVSDTESKVATAETRVSEVEAELSTLKAAERSRARVALLVNDLKYPKDKAESLVKTLSDKSDEDFKVVAQLFAPLTTSATQTDTSEVIDTAEVVEEAPLTTSASPTNDDVEAKRLALANYWNHKRNKK
jgi:hypothetical protein